MKTLHTHLAAVAMLAISLSCAAQKDIATETAAVAETNTLVWKAVYPVPVITSFTLSVNSGAETTAVLRLIDLLGRTALERPISLLNGDNQFEVNMADMAAGMYQLVLQTDSKRLTYKLLKAQ